MLTPEFQKEVHELAKSKGWWDTSREFGTLIALCHSEVSEAYDEYEQDATKPEVVTEIADVVIRVLDLAEYYGFDVTEIDTRFPSDEPFPEFLCELHTMLSGALEAARCNEPDAELAIRWLRNVVSKIVTYKPLKGFIEPAIYSKHNRNKERSHKHGGKLF